MRLGVQRDGSDATQVLADVVRIAEVVRTSIEPLHDPAAGPVTWWSSQQLHTWSHRPWHKDGKQLPFVHAARAEFEVKSADFAAMSSWLGQVGGQPGVELHGVEWALTAVHRTALVDEVRVAAVRDAVAKATAYGSAFGTTTIRAVAVADAGMLGPGPDDGGRFDAMYSRMPSDAGGGSEPQFAPRDIAVTATVDARFVVG